MRTIKFRAKRIDTGEWTYWTPPGSYSGIIQKPTLGEFTGLLDLNGKEIYEGDIVRHDTGTGVVAFENGMFTFASDKVPFKMIGATLQDPEVIGNVYENGGLLKS